MSFHISFDYSKALSFFQRGEFDTRASQVRMVHHLLHEKNSTFAPYLGWVNPSLSYYEKMDVDRLLTVANRVQKIASVLLVVGVGGSSLGARAAINLLTSSFKRNVPQIIFIGDTMDGEHLSQLLDFLEGEEVVMNVISKSGTTLEPAITFRIFQQFLEKKYGNVEAQSRIIVTTDAEKGALRIIAENRGYETFAIPPDIGGRFSVVTPVGLFPMAVSGIDVREVLAGVAQAASDYSTPHLYENSAYQYAVARNLLYELGKYTEILVTYRTSMEGIAEWWKQLFGESEGKHQGGIFPASATFPRDLHSFGQYIQEGKRHLFETLVYVEQIENDVCIPHSEDDIDQLNYLAGRTVDSINKKVFEGAMLAHVDGGVPNLAIRLPDASPFTFGYLVYFFMKACAMSGLLAGVQPFDQPGVDAYKQNIFALLGKPGFQYEQRELNERLKHSLRGYVHEDT